MTTVLPLDAAEVERSRRPLGEAVMLPAAAYTAPDVLAWERTRLFDGGWVCVGRAAAVTGAGTQLAVGGALLVRDGDDLRVFANVCRHRGHELLGDGQVATRAGIRCPYHGWSYGLDGSLRRAAGTTAVDDIDAFDCALAPMRAEVRHGWVFVNADGRAPALDLGILDDVLDAYAPGELVRVASHDYEVAANWKVVHENYQECLHCPSIHPQLCTVSPPDSGDNVEPGPWWVGGWMDLAADAATMSTTGALVGTVRPRLDDRARRRVGYFALLPSLLVSLHPDYVMTHRLTPVAPDRTRVECEWLFAPDAVAAAGFDPAPAVDFWDLTNRQDWSACESVQRGIGSPSYRPGPILGREDAVHDLVGIVARAYLEDL